MKKLLTVLLTVLLSFTTLTINVVVAENEPVVQEGQPQQDSQQGEPEKQDQEGEEKRAPVETEQVPDTIGETISEETEKSFDDAEEITKDAVKDIEEETLNEWSASAPNSNWKNPSFNNKNITYDGTKHNLLGSLSNISPTTYMAPFYQNVFSIDNGENWSESEDMPQAKDAGVYTILMKYQKN